MNIANDDTVTIAIDVMSGDYGMNVTMPACIKFLLDYKHLGIYLILVGDYDKIQEYLSINRNISRNDYESIVQRIEIVASTQIVAMDELPQNALRQKKDSSMRIAINLVKEKKANAIVSAGNTGALMATARYVLRMIDGIDRPAIAKIIPTISHDICVLDLGANTENEPEHLMQFAIMGRELMKIHTKKPDPSIGLLNIGREEIKGTPAIKQAFSILKDSGLNFFGNIEGNDISHGIVDVVVCDGFTGNVVLKTLEGTAKMISQIVRQEFSRNIIAKAAAFCASSVLSKIKARMNVSKYNGAMLVGLNGVVVKSHGGANSVEFYYAILQAYNDARNGFVDVLKLYLQENIKIIDNNEDKNLIDFYNSNITSI